MDYHAYTFLSQLPATHYDTLLVSLTDKLQHIEDPRVRFATLSLHFLLTCQELGTDPRRVLEYTGRAIEDARKQDTAEMRGLVDYIRKEMNW